MLAQYETKSSLTAYYAQIKEAYHARLAQGSGEHTRSYAICNSAIDISFANGELFNAASPLFAPLANDDIAQERLKVFLFDSPSASWPVPIPDFLAERSQRKLFTPRNHSVEPVHFFRDDRFSIAWHEWNPIAEMTILDRLHHEAFVCLKNFGNQNSNCYLHSPLRNLFSAWFEERQALLVHGATVGIPAGGILIAGSNGSGKSTCALSCLGTQLKFAGDDSALISLTPSITAHMLYASGSLWHKDADSFPQLKNLFNSPNSNGHKSSVSLADKPEWLIASFPLKAIFVTQFSRSAHSSIEPITRGIALRVLAPSSLTRNPAQMAKSFEQMAMLVSSLPCFRLNIGSSFKSIPKVLEEFIWKQLCSLERHAEL